MIISKTSSRKAGPNSTKDPQSSYNLLRPTASAMPTTTSARNSQRTTSKSIAPMRKKWRPSINATARQKSTGTVPLIILKERLISLCPTSANPRNKNCSSRKGTWGIPGKRQGIANDRQIWRRYRGEFNWSPPRRRRRRSTALTWCTWKQALKNCRNLSWIWTFTATSWTPSWKPE